jgi:hypothetical protein
LWNHLYVRNDSISDTWIVGGDFNCILHASEKSGGLPFYLSQAFDFLRWRDSLGVLEIPMEWNQFS